MYTVFVPVGSGERTKYYEGLGNASKPVAWFDDRKRALDYAAYLATVGESAVVAYMPENFVDGTGYVGEVISRLR